MGMVSTHWRDVHELSAVELSALDVLARMAADLIERSRAEEKVRESEERLRFAQETADIGTFDVDLDSGVLTWTPKLEQCMACRLIVVFRARGQTGCLGPS